MKKKGKFGKYGGQYVSETLMSALIDLDTAYEKIKKKIAGLPKNWRHCSPNMPVARLLSRSARTYRGTWSAEFT